MPLLDSLDQRHRLALRLLLALIAICGIVLSVYIAREESRQSRTLERLRIGETIDTHFVAVSEHIQARTSLAKAVSRFFTPPPLSQGNPLGKFGAQALGLASDLTTVGWLPEVEPSRAEDALKSLAASGVAAPAFRGPDGKLIDPEKLDRPLYPIIDIAPPAQSLRARRRCRLVSGPAARHSQRQGNARSHAHQAAAPRAIAGSECAVALRADL